jgi:hypothetical protein
MIEWMVKWLTLCASLGSLAGVGWLCARELRTKDNETPRPREDVQGRRDNAALRLSEEYGQYRAADEAPGTAGRSIFADRRQDDGFVAAPADLLPRLQALPFGATEEEIRRRIPDINIQYVTLTDGWRNLRSVDDAREALFYRVNRGSATARDAEYYALFAPPFVEYVKKEIDWFRDRALDPHLSDGITKIIAVVCTGETFTCSPLWGTEQRGVHTAQRPFRLHVPVPRAAEVTPAQPEPQSQPPPGPVFDPETMMAEVESFWTTQTQLGSLDTTIRDFMARWRPVTVILAPAAMAGGVEQLRDATKEEEENYDKNIWSLWAVSDGAETFWVMPSISMERKRAGRALSAHMGESNPWQGWFAVQRGDRFSVIRAARAARTADGRYALREKGVLKTWD